MKREEIAHLATLSRIRLSDDELTHLEGELSSIVEYVSVVKDIAAEEAAAVPQVGARFNIFRQDEVTNEPDQYTKDILAEMPQTKGRYMAVKKILDIGE
ncbi:MAG: Asp-tRNA(Asn)/Glu-tRNA(Gln) amidotransferase subunit GatC [Candidatus Pacebacteria bacterium]|jgi:aspartyl-tRNA(Asn)/glutamyl-tRNA(Gln) amidotransferase subunit C|nr:Asp-tRNA(Asn)/Glu-tRNA(Gln) amidotransferase subunit GatC [Candidatus Paceibacterota bacterium]